MVHIFAAPCDLSGVPQLPLKPAFTDIPPRGLKRFLPPTLRACFELARLDRPIGAWLLLFPCFWSLALSGVATPGLFLLFGVGAFVMRGAGCTINDIVDRRIDGLVERTRGRPLPSGQIGVRGALVFLACQLAAGAAILFQLNLPPSCSAALHWPSSRSIPSRRG